MTAKWTLASSATSGDRLLNVGHASRQLSTGDMVQLVYDPAASNPNKITLQLITAASGHTATSFITTLSTDNFSITTPVPQGLALEVDGSDNIYVVGQDASSGELDQPGVQGFTKGVGLSWTAQPYVTNESTATNGANLYGVAIAWSGTGGGTNGKGHLMSVWNDGSSGNTYAATLDCGKILTGAKGFIVHSYKNPSFLGGVGVTATAGSNLDISTDGVGGTSGLAAIADNATHVQTGAYGVTSGGVLTDGGGLSDSRVSGTLSTSTKVRVVWFASGQFATIFRSSANAGQLTVVSYSTSAYLGQIDSGTASNFPAPSATLSWAPIAAPASATTLWLFGWSSATASSMLRLPVLFTNGVPTVGSVVTDDTSVGTAGTTIRADSNPVDTLHADWEAYQSTSTYSMLGDFSSLAAAPNAPNLLTPINGSIPPISTGGTFTWQFSSLVGGDAQTVFFFRRLAAAGYQWWNGSSWTTAQVNPTGGAEVGVTSATQAVTFPTGQWTVATSYTWAVKTTGSGVSPQTGPYASAFSLIVANLPPATPTLTASYSAVTNTTTLTLHSTDSTGPTGSIEFSDDGGVTWNFLRYCTALTIYPGTSTAYDIEAPSGATRQYRARSWTGAPQSFSAYATATTAPAITQYWLRDLTGALGSVNLNVVKGTLSTTFPEPLTEHDGLGNPAAIVVADVIGLENGQATFWTNTIANEAALTSLMVAQRTLLLQAPTGEQWYVRIVSARPTDRPYGATTKYQHHAISWRGQNRP